jgi:hypothetical protein
MRPNETCSLCLNDRELCFSHLIPKSAYKPLRSAKSPNPNPLILTEKTSYTSSWQVADYLLCLECEQRFREKGEDWVLAHSYRGPGKFRFREILHANQPMFEGPEGLIYSTSMIPDLNMEAIIYFASSVFWRAGAHRWRRDRMIINIDLGKYEEPLRLFLRGELTTWCSDCGSRACKTICVPWFIFPKKVERAASEATSVLYRG